MTYNLALFLRQFIQVFPHLQLGFELYEHGVNVINQELALANY